MDLPDGIRKFGFRKWYQRELMQSHAHLVLLFLCAIGLLATFEVFNRSAPWTEQAFDVGALLLLVAVGVWSLRRYLFLLIHAEQVANQAVCERCKTYGRLNLLKESRTGHQVTVRCKKCENEWPISH
ncbi:MAG: hypothetical protein OEY03_15515 [Rhizobacter sp.]|nr:hypothetical protein [Rhizobacter sp.]